MSPDNFYYACIKIEPPNAYGGRRRGIKLGDVERAADALFRAGDRPTIEKVRAKLGTGSPNTINPLLHAWWKKLSSRLEAGPAALHRLPESVAEVAEALWMRALDEGRRRAHLELQSTECIATDEKHAQDTRPQLLSLREGQIASRLRDRIANPLEERIHEITVLLRKGDATRAAQGRRILALEEQLLAMAKESKKTKSPAIPRAAPQRHIIRRIATVSDARQKKSRVAQQN